MKDALARCQPETLRQQIVLARFGEVALRSDDLDEILTEACQLVGDALGTDLAKVMELQASGETLLVRAGVGWKPGVVGEVTVPIKEDTSEGYALKTGQPVISPDIEMETRFKYPSFLTDHGVKAVANVLIIGAKDKKPFGILQIDSRLPRAFDDNDITFLRSYANLLAAAVDRMRALEEVRDGRERLSLALDAGELGSWELDLGSGAATCSPRFGEIFGYATLLPAWTIDILMAQIVPEDRVHVAVAFRCASEAKAELHCEFRIRRAIDGDTRWIEAQGRPIDVRDNTRSSHMLGIVADITPRKATEGMLRLSNELLEAKVAERTQALSEANARLRAEATEREEIEGALRQSQKMEAVGQLTGGIAHDFNNMLQAIGGNLELMGRRIQQGRLEDAASLMDNARKTVERAAFLTNRLLAFSRQRRLQPHRVEPAALVHGMIELTQRTVGPAIVVEELTYNDIGPVLCDPHQLEAALLNVAINARDAMPDGGRLTIGTRKVRLTASDVAREDGARPGDYVEIVVADTGMGMDEATQMRAFDPFFTTKPIGKGTGLGLSQLYGFIRQSGGLVRLDSSLGRGTTVRLYLPNLETALEGAARPAVETGPETVAANAVVLLLDDEIQVRVVVAETLRNLRYHVLEAGDSSTALQVLRENIFPRIDLLVTEVDLPGGLGGWQVAIAARATKPDLPVLFLTASGALDQQLRPGMAVLGKPFTRNSIATKLRSMIGGVPDASLN